MNEATYGDVYGNTVDIPEARALTVGPDEILVIVFPQFVGAVELAAHREHFNDILGKRFILVSGGDVMLAKVKDENWGRPAIGGPGDH